MNNYFRFSSKSVLLAVALVVLGSCKDAWDSHYSFKETESKYPVAKIAETLGDISGFDKFITVLSTTRMVDKNGTPLNMSYLDLLYEDQFLTVWAPSNSSVPDSLWTKYMAKNKTRLQHKEVGEQFIQNHIARFKHSVGEGSNEKIYMLNGKAYTSKNDGIAGQPYHSTDRNIRCSNGVLHCIDGYLDYLPSLYEYITTAPAYKEIFGDWFKSFTIEELDPSRSVAQGFNDLGEMVYIDSVMIESNMLMSRYGRIHTEDSTFAIVLPTPELWATVYDEIKERYVYAENNLNNDSLQQYYTRTTMMADMFYNINPKVQRYMPDSVFSTRYSQAENRREGLPFHIFSHPYDKTSGLFGSAVDSVECSNGIIYFIDKWPFADTLTYLRQIKLEAETYQNLSGLILRSQTVQRVDTTTLDNPIQVMRIAGDGVSNWTGKIYISNNLKGKYSVKMVMAPNTVSEMPNYIHPKISYQMPNGKVTDLIDSSVTESVEYRPGKYRVTKIPFYAINKLDRLDTIDLGIVDLPYCNYDMNQAKLSITLTSGVNEKNSEKYSSEIWLDCIILDPVR